MQHPQAVNSFPDINHRISLPGDCVLEEDVSIALFGLCVCWCEDSV
jgi:hypothetical protein